jgi:cyclophilin family peptidyl-prolyl cis-trans isomerase
MTKAKALCSVGLALFLASCEKTPLSPANETASPATTPLTTAQAKTDAHPRVVMEASLGKIVIELDREKAPITVDNFLAYVDKGFFNGTIFHRVIPTFMIQGGGFEPGMKQRPTRSPIKNEATNGLKNLRGTIAMARTNDPHSATAQFFINVKDNPNLDNGGPNGFGYCVFGRVIGGMDVVDKIRVVPTGQIGGHADVPKQDVVIRSVVRQ